MYVHIGIGCKQNRLRFALATAVPSRHSNTNKHQSNAHWDVTPLFTRDNIFSD